MIIWKKHKKHQKKHNSHNIPYFQPVSLTETNYLLQWVMTPGIEL